MPTFDFFEGSSQNKNNNMNNDGMNNSNSTFDFLGSSPINNDMSNSMTINIIK